MNDTSTTHLHTLSLHDALPICSPWPSVAHSRGPKPKRRPRSLPRIESAFAKFTDSRARKSVNFRSEEHTSELQSRRDLVCRLLLEKKKKSTVMIRTELYRKEIA